MKQNGNALFLILIAVGILAALTFAVTNSSRMNTNLDDETIELTVNEIFEQSSNLEYSLKRFLLVNEYDISEIDLYDAAKGDNGNLTSCSTDACNLFHTNGGGVSAPQLPTNAFDSAPTSCNSGLMNGRYKYHFRITSFDSIGTDLPEIVLIYNCVRDEVCDAVNYRLNLLEKGDADIEHSKGSFGTDYGSFNGSSPALSGLTPDFIGSEDARVVGQKMFCEKAPSVSLGNTLYSVILAR